MLISPPAHAAYYDVSLTPTGVADFRAADYHLWVPPGAKTLRGVIVRQHGCGAGSTVPNLWFAHDLAYQALAQKHGLALLATRLASSDCGSWSQPENGSDDAFGRALQELSVKSGHPELAGVPWILDGYSGGAAWTMEMTERHPTRIAVAFAARSRVFSNRPPTLSYVAAWLSPSPEHVKAVAEIPILLASGIKDVVSRDKDPRSNGKDALLDPKDDLRQRFSRPAGLPWTLAADPESGHGLGNLAAFALPYLDAVLTQRLPPAGSAPDAPFRPLDRSRAWLGDVRSGEIAPLAEYRGDVSRAAFLPDENLARRWKPFILTGQIPETAPLPVPQDLTARRLAPDTVEVTWSCAAPLDRPVPGFGFYRDGKRFSPSKIEHRGYDASLTPPRWSLALRDKIAPDARPLYQISTVRAAGGTGQETQSPLSLGATAPPAPAHFTPAPITFDLAVTKLELVPPNPLPGQAVVLRATVANRGQFPTPDGVPLSAAFRVDGKPVSWDQVPGPILPGASLVLTAQVVEKPVWKAEPGKHTFWVQLDELGRLGEVDRAHFSLTRELTVPAKAEDAK